MSSLKLDWYICHTASIASHGNDNIIKKLQYIFSLMNSLNITMKKHLILRAYQQIWQPVSQDVVVQKHKQ